MVLLAGRRPSSELRRPQGLSLPQSGQFSLRAKAQVFISLHPSSIWHKCQLLGSTIPMLAWVRHSPHEVVANAQAGKEHYGRNKRFLGSLGLSLAFLFTACDFQGPWSYYPEETEVYQGIYTFGYIVADESPYVCFSKVYGLTENSAENFAFYDSASVTVSGKFESGVDSISLKSLYSEGNPNCFAGGPEYAGVSGESYTLNAVIKWDSADHKVTTEMKAVAKIPTKIHAKGVIPPSAIGNGTFVKNEYSYLQFDFLEYPYDVLTYKIPMEYDESVRGIQMTLVYDNVDGGESMNTTMLNMLSAFLDPDTVGYLGMAMKRPEEKTASMGFETRRMLAGRNTLDTMEYPGMTMPVGKSTVRFYATDQAYVDYKNTVLEAIDDARVVPNSNVENGMGVFSGMLKDSIMLEIHSENFITYDYMKAVNCENLEEDDEVTPWDSRYCRLYQDRYCVDTLRSVEGDGKDFKVREHPACYPSLVKLAMTLDTNKWSYFLPDALSSQKKNEAYADGLKRYCVASNFTSNKIADCKSLKEDCMVSLEKTNCKEYLWTWCSDRDWNIGEYPQCGSALVSRYYLEDVESPILKREVDLWCDEHSKDSQCSR